MRRFFTGASLVGRRPGRDELRNRYLNLLERAVLHTLYHPTDKGVPPRFARQALETARESGRRLVIRPPAKARAEGRDWPIYAPTMVGTERLRNVRLCVESVLAERVPGDLIEAGCWRGGGGHLHAGHPRGAR